MATWGCALAVVLLIGANLCGGARAQVAVAVTLKETMFQKLLANEVEAINAAVEQVVIQGQSFNVGSGVHVNFNSFSLQSFSIGSFIVQPLSQQQLRVAIENVNFHISTGCGASWEPKVCLPFVGCFCFPFCASCGGTCEADGQSLSLTLTVTLGLVGDVLQATDTSVASGFADLHFSYNPSGFFCQLASDVIGIFTNINSDISNAIDDAFQRVSSVGGAVQRSLNDYLGTMHGMCGVNTYQGSALTLFMSSGRNGCSITYAPDLSLFDITVNDYSVVLQIGYPPANNSALFGCLTEAQCCHMPGTGQPGCAFVGGSYLLLTGCQFCMAIDKGVWYLGGTSNVNFVKSQVRLH